MGHKDALSPAIVLPSKEKIEAVISTIKASINHTLIREAMLPSPHRGLQESPHSIELRSFDCMVRVNSLQHQIGAEDPRQQCFSMISFLPQWEKTCHTSLKGNEIAAPESLASLGPCADIAPAPLEGPVMTPHQLPASKAYDSLKATIEASRTDLSAINKVKIEDIQSISAMVSEMVSLSRSTKIPQPPSHYFIGHADTTELLFRLYKCQTMLCGTEVIEEFNKKKASIQADLKKFCHDAPAEIDREYCKYLGTTYTEIVATWFNGVKSFFGNLIDPSLRDAPSHSMHISAESDEHPTA